MNRPSTVMGNVLRIALLGVGLSGITIGVNAATIIIINADTPGVGLNDQTPRAPEGGNTGTTLGQQRMIALQHVADAWGAKLVSAVPIRVQISFPDSDFVCASNPGDFVYLAYSGPTGYYTGRPPFAAQPLVYPKALRNALVGVEVDPSKVDIFSRVSPKLDSTPNCMSGYTGFWYGIDPNIAPPFTPPVGPTKLSIVSLLTHEFAHGFGFIAGGNLANGSAFPGYQFVWNNFLFDLGIGLRWQDMTDGQRQASAKNDPNLIWTGHNTDGAGPVHMRPPYRLRIGNAAQAGEVKQAYFGALIPRPGIAGVATVANDGSANPTQACGPLVNAAQILGRIAVIDRGTCAFGIKARNAQNAGAAAMLLLNNRAEAPGDPLPTVAADDFSLRIPTVSVAYQTGLDLRAALAATPNTPIAIELVPSMPDVGTNAGFVRMFAPATLQPSSSVSHFTNELNAPLLMRSDVTGASFDNVDMTVDLLRDVGWPLAPGVGNTIFTNGFDPTEIH